MHENANITFNRAESSTLMSSILALQPREGGGGGGKSSDEIVIDVIDDAEERMPALLDEDDKGPTLCGNQPVCRVHDDAAMLDPLSNEEPASPRHRAGVASMAWRTTRWFSTNAP